MLAEFNGNVESLQSSGEHGYIDNDYYNDEHHEHLTASENIGLKV